jgi:outer membrane protein OmpA-like peptidoglycan-associated protein
MRFGRKFTALVLVAGVAVTSLLATAVPAQAGGFALVRADSGSISTYSDFHHTPHVATQNGTIAVVWRQWSRSTWMIGFRAGSYDAGSPAGSFTWLAPLAAGAAGSATDQNLEVLSSQVDQDVPPPREPRVALSKDRLGVVAMWIQGPTATPSVYVRVGSRAATTSPFTWAPAESLGSGSSASLSVGGSLAAVTWTKPGSPASVQVRTSSLGVSGWSSWAAEHQLSSAAAIGPPAVVASAGSESQVIVASDGSKALAVWREDIDGTPTVRASAGVSSTSVSWSAGQTLAASGRSPSASVSADGTKALAAWVDVAGEKTIIKSFMGAWSSGSGTYTWETATEVSSGALDGDVPKIAIAETLPFSTQEPGVTRAVAVWQETSGSNKIIRGRVLTVGSPSTWGSVSTLSATNVVANSPDVSVNPGTVFDSFTATPRAVVTWNLNTPLTSDSRAQAAAGDLGVASPWARPLTLESGTGSAVSSQPTVAFTGRDSAAIMYTERTDGSTNVRADRYRLNAASNDASLSALSVSSGATLSPTFAANTLDYTATMTTATATFAFTATRANAAADIRYKIDSGDFADVTSGSAITAINFDAGDTKVITIEVTAQDNTQRLYTISVTRSLPSTDATLSALSVSAGTLDPVFSSSTETYAVAAASGTSTTTVTYTRGESGSTVQYSLTGDSYSALNSGSTSISLVTGANTLRIKVTASDTTTVKVYVITVTRAAASSDATLASLTFSSLTLSPAFASGTTSYTSSVANNVTSVTLSPTRTDAGATIQYRLGSGSFVAVTSGTSSSPIALAEGSNVIEIKVTAADGSTVTYSVAVTRAESSPPGGGGGGGGDTGGGSPAPAITGPSAPSVYAGSTFVADLSADRAVTWSISGGANASLFTINADGVLRFRTSPTAGTYTVEVSATDAQGGVTKRTITVTVNGAAQVAPGSGPTAGGGFQVTDSNGKVLNVQSISGSDKQAGAQVKDGQIVITNEQFSGKVKIDVVVVALDGSTSAATIEIVVLPKAPTTVQMQFASLANPAIKSGVYIPTTTVAWKASPNAIGYDVLVNGASVSTTTATTFRLRQVIGPKTRVTVVALGNDGTIAPAVVAALKAAPITIGRAGFAANSAKLTPAIARILDQVVIITRAAGFKRIVVEGHTDNSGPASQSKPLSQARAAVVAEYVRSKLTSAGVVVTVRYAGDSKPVASNKTKSGREANRRVDISFR